MIHRSDVWWCIMMHSGLCSKHDALRRDRSQSLCTWSPLPPTQPSSPSHSLARLKQDHKVFFQIRIPCEPSCSFWFTANRGPASHHFWLLLGQQGPVWSWLIWAFSIETLSLNEKNGWANVIFAASRVATNLAFLCRLGAPIVAFPCSV